LGTKGGEGGGRAHLNAGSEKAAEKGERNALPHDSLGSGKRETKKKTLESRDNSREEKKKKGKRRESLIRRKEKRGGEGTSILYLWRTKGKSKGNPLRCNQ